MYQYIEKKKLFEYKTTYSFPTKLRILKIWYLKQFFLKFFSHYPISRAFLFPSASSHWQCCLEGKPLGCGTLMDRHGDQEPLGGDCHTASGILTTEDP